MTTTTTQQDLHDTTIPSLGPATIASPFEKITFTPDDARVLRDIEYPPRLPEGATLPVSFEKAGPRERIFFAPAETTFGILTSGGLCPGINDVLRSIVLELRYRYGVQRILGFRYGFSALDPDFTTAKQVQERQTLHPPRQPMVLTPDVVRDIHARGGSLLGTSRGARRPDVMVETLLQHRVDVLLAIGGDGTMRAASALHKAAVARGARISIVGIPKTIDNDIPFVDKTFGFDTAITMARLAIDAAHAEARSVDNGIGLVKLMGRNAGFIAAHAALASRDVNACLVPEVPFKVEQVLSWLEQRLRTRGHAVVVVAEGCADQIDEVRENSKMAVDSSGNRRYAAPSADVGRYLQSQIERHFSSLPEHPPITLKYVDPSYMLRGMRSTSEDAVFCDALARNAVHAAMAGKTGMMVGRWHRSFTHIPLSLVLSAKKRIDPDGELWRDVIETTGQPDFWSDTLIPTPHFSVTSLDQI